MIRPVTICLLLYDIVHQNILRLKVNGAILCYQTLFFRKVSCLMKPVVKRSFPSRLGWKVLVRAWTHQTQQVRLIPLHSFSDLENYNCINLFLILQKRVQMSVRVCCIIHEVRRNVLLPVRLHISSEEFHSTYSITKKT